jgi:hypothetical protein
MRIEVAAIAHMHARGAQCGGAGLPGPRIHLEGRDRTLHIPMWGLRGTTASLLARQIIEKAGLCCVRMGRWDLGARYEP